MFLISFTLTGSQLVGKVLGDEEAIFGNFVVFMSVVGLCCGLVAAKRDTPDTLTRAFLAGLFSGLISGIFIGAFALFMGAIQAKGTDLRGYLQSLGPDTISGFLFGLPAQKASLLHLTLFTITGVIGGLLARGVFRAEWRKKLSSRKITAQSSKKSSSFIQDAIKNRWVKYGMLALLAFALIILPRTWGSYWNYVMGTVGIYILLGLGVNLIIGLAGQLILGYVAFFAIGAYTFALLTAPLPHNIRMNFWIALAIGVVAATLTGILIGLPILNLRGDYLAIVTLGFGEIVRIMIRSDIMIPLTDGPRGVRSIPGPTLFGKSFASDVDYMYLIIIAVLVISFIAQRLQKSSTGRAWMAISQDETVAQTTGVNKFSSKLLALALSAGIAGLAGVLFASRNQFTGPDDHNLLVSINVICLLIVGGMGSFPGIILGAFALKGLPELLRELENFRMLIFGALLVIMMLFRPEGLWPAKRPKLEGPPPVKSGQEGGQP
jgi:ABC-type branched-subunit amino acid transport system permease subunit